MCAVMSSYVHACAAAGVSLNGWRNTACRKFHLKEEMPGSELNTEYLCSSSPNINEIHAFHISYTEKYSAECPATMVYDYSMTSCDRTCRALGQADMTCQVDFVPVDGCGCAEGTYLNDKGECVTASKCPCYHEDEVVLPGRSVNIYGQQW